MANVKIEGTFYMEGLLEGPLLSDDDAEIINAFVKQTEKAGLKFHAAINTGRFSLLANTEPLNAKSTGESADALIVKYLGEFLKNYSPKECVQLMSTLRSVEYIPGNEIQTIYCIKPDCTVAAEQRIVRTDTVSPAKPADLKHTIKIILPLIIVLCAGIGISAFFIPYRDIAQRIINDLAPFDPNNVTIDNELYKQFFRVEVLEADKNNGIIQIICMVSESFPKTEQELNNLWNSSNDSLSQKLVTETLARNCIRCVFYDSEGQFLGQKICYMQWLEEDKKTFGLIIPFDKDFKKIQMTY